jgi:hypothetical protein
LKNTKHMHTRKELETHYIPKRRLGCDSNAPQVRSAWPVSARVIKVNHHKTNRLKTRPYLILKYLKVVIWILLWWYFYALTYD